MRDIGGGVFESCGPDGPRRHIPTTLPADVLATLLGDVPDDGGALRVHVAGDPESARR